MPCHTYLFSTSEQHQVQYKHKESLTARPHCLYRVIQVHTLIPYTQSNPAQLDVWIQRTEVFIVWEVQGKAREPAN